MSDREYMDTNRAHWDEVTPIHVDSDFYAVDEFKAGKTKLKRVELEELTGVAGKTLLHLQCHFGLDTLSWAREGAIVTGADFSEPAIAQARALADECGIDARFVVSNIYDLPKNLDGQFDIIFTSYGVLTWLPDLERWAQVVAHFLRPGGTFYIVEFHPMQHTLDYESVDEPRLRYPYFRQDAPLRWDDAGDYTQRDVTLEQSVTFEFQYPLGDVVTALIDAGLRIDFLHEFPFSTYQLLPYTEVKEDGTVRLKHGDGTLPLLFSIKATKPA